MNRLFSILVIVLAAYFFQGCASTKSISNSNLSSLYKRGNKLLEPQFDVFHKKHGQTDVHFKVNTKQLLYVRNPADSLYSGKIKISYLLYKHFDSNELIDSASTVLTDVTDSLQSKNLYGKFSLTIPIGNRYILRVKTTDLNRKQETEKLIVLDRETPTNRQNFLVLNEKTNLPFFEKYGTENDSLRVVYNMLLAADEVTVDFYNREFPVAPPPFAVYKREPFSYEPDSSYTVTTGSDSSFNFTPAKKGFYHFKVDSKSREGLTFYHFDKQFPEIYKVEDMISALRFITSKREYEQLQTAQNKKVAVDSFWIQLADSKKRARELIKTFYNRVQNANYFFTSYKEGWKTDRGIVYLVFGPPEIVYKSSTGESWIYGEENNYLSTTFNFVKMNNPFSDNDYLLKRSPSYKNAWYRAVEKWREGRVSSLDY
jgi:GWxTD domain-containing protein